MINSFTGRYYFLSNFYPVSMVFRGITFLSSEAAFQAQKAKSMSERRRFSNLSPDEAKHMGRRVSLRSDWEYVKDDVMYQVCYAKFIQHPELVQALLATGNEPLEEGNTWGDRYWGTVNGVGRNQLGKTMMKLREELLKV